MRILFISRNVLAGDLVRCLQREGHEVRLFIDDREARRCLDGFVSKATNWKSELRWVGKNGLIIFDDCGFGAEQDSLRKRGYLVVGGSREADKLELNRGYAQGIFKEYGLKTVPLKDFKNPKDALEFAKQWRVSWVVKQRHGIDKALTFVGKEHDGSDVIEFLTKIAANKSYAKEPISLHKRLEGVEIGVGRYFNGRDWIGPIEFNVEHPHLLPGNNGPITNELGTLAWYSTDEVNRLYQETLAKLKPYLRKIKFKGDFALNCIVNQDGAFILEATPRLGSPIIHLQQALHFSPWGDFLYALAAGRRFNLEWKSGYGVVVLLAIPPFPYAAKRGKSISNEICFSLAQLDKKERERIHFEGVSCQKEDEDIYTIRDPHGYVLYVADVGDSIKEARDKVYSSVKKIKIPNAIFRNDIGLDFAEKGMRALRKWGYDMRTDFRKRKLKMVLKKPRQRSVAA